MIKIETILKTWQLVLLLALKLDWISPATAASFEAVKKCKNAFCL